MIDTNTVLLVLVVLAWGVFVSVMMLSGKQKCSSRSSERKDFILEDFVQTRIKDTDSRKDEVQTDVQEQEQEQEHKHEQKEHFGSTGYYNDVSSVLPVKLEGNLAETQNNSNDIHTINVSLVNMHPPVLFSDVQMNDYPFRSRGPYTAENINAFCDFLGSTFDKVNFKYHINSLGPLI